MATNAGRKCVVNVQWQHTEKRNKMRLEMIVYANRRVVDGNLKFNRSS